MHVHQKFGENKFLNFELKEKGDEKVIEIATDKRADVISKKIIKICVGVMLSCAVVTVSGICYAKHRNSFNGIGGAEIWSNVSHGLHSIETSIPREEISYSKGFEKELQDEMLANAVDSEEIYSPLSLTYFTYRIKKGDMISVLAEQFGVTQDTIISVNNIKQSRLIQIGQCLKIPMLPGILYTVKEDGETVASIAEKYKETSLEKCASLNGLESDTSLPAGKIIFVPDAVLDWATRQEINGDLFTKPIRASYRLSSYYGWRSSPFSGGRSFHSGVDMAASQGTRIYAALSGRVTFAGYNATYGNYVIVTHHSGYQTLYGHMTSYTVKVGEYVDTNKLIGYVGSTGLSTGPHLHFTVMKNGKTVNPLGLWK